MFNHQFRITRYKRIAIVQNELKIVEKMSQDFIQTGIISLFYLNIKVQD